MQGLRRRPDEDREKDREKSSTGFVTFLIGIVAAGAALVGAAAYYGAEEEDKNRQKIKDRRYR